MTLSEETSHHVKDGIIDFTAGSLGKKQVLHVHNFKLHKLICYRGNCIGLRWTAIGYCKSKNANISLLLQ